jgi:membrane-bound lytic murein transglycosylase A
MDSKREIINARVAEKLHWNHFCCGQAPRYRIQDGATSFDRACGGTILVCGHLHAMQTGREFASPFGHRVIASLIGATIYFATTAAFADGLLKFSGSQLEPMKWSELAGWSADDHLAAFAAYQTSCRAMLKLRRSDERGEISAALSNVCRKAVDLQPQDTEAARTFFEQNFQPVRIGPLGEAQGLLTGYFEPIVAGSRFPTPEFHVPLYRRPRDLEAAGYKPGTLAFPNKGGRIGRRNDKNELMPYYDRAAIEAGALDGQGLEICWLKSSSDLLAIQIEGSGRVILEDGTPLRVAFDSHNGYAFSSIERVLIDRNVIARKDISTQAIRDWMAAHPDEAAKVRAANRSYIFFRITGLTNEGEPLGAQGVPLTPGRSIAVDRVHQYGTPFFIDADLPSASGRGASPFRRLMIAQDTGSAIVGPARADLYWGAGEEAGRIAGRIRHPGRFMMLLPRELDIAVAAREAPLPVPKPKIAELEVGKESGKGKVELGDTDGKSHAKAADIGAAAGKALPSPQPKPKLAALDVKKQDDKGKANSANAGASATGRQKPAPSPNMKIAALDDEKREGKGKSKSIVLPVLKPKGSAADGKKQDGKGKDAKDKGETVAASSTATAAGLRKPSPTTKSKAATDDVKKAEGKKPEGKGKGETVAASSTAIAAGLHKPSPKSKTAEVEAKKPDGKGKPDSAKAGRSADSDKTAPPAKSKTVGTDVKKPDAKGKAKAADADGDGKAAKSSRPAAPARKSDRS